MRNILLVAAALAVTASGASAQTGKTSSGGRDAAFGRLAVMAADSIMAKGDLDASGSLDAAELRRLGTMMGRRGGLDANGWTAGDRNRDGRISRGELVEVFRSEISRAAVARRGM